MLTVGLRLHNSVELSILHLLEMIVVRCDRIDNGLGRIQNYLIPSTTSMGTPSKSLFYIFSILLHMTLGIHPYAGELYQITDAALNLIFLYNEIACSEGRELVGNVQDIFVGMLFHIKEKEDPIQNSVYQFCLASRGSC